MSRFYIILFFILFLQVVFSDCILTLYPFGAILIIVANPIWIVIFQFARVVELVDSLASGASVRKDVRVRLPPRAPKTTIFLSEIVDFL